MLVISLCLLKKGDSTCLLLKISLNQCCAVVHTSILFHRLYLIILAQLPERLVPISSHHWVRNGIHPGQVGNHKIKLYL